MVGEFINAFINSHLWSLF